MALFSGKLFHFFDRCHASCYFSLMPENQAVTAQPENPGRRGGNDGVYEPDIQKASVENAWILRLLAYVLVFAAGLATMFAIDRTFLKSAPPRVDSAAVNEPPAVVDTSAAIAQKPILDEPKTIPVPEAESPKSIPPPAAIGKTSRPLRVAGVTEPAPGRYAKLPLATSQAVAFVDVKLGDRVKKGWQVFSHWESPERLQAMKGDLEKTKKLLELAKTRATAADQTVERMKRIKGSISDQELQDATTASSIRKVEMEAAQLALAESESRFAAMEFEFKQSFVTSPIDGIVASVDVVPGERRQLSGAFRGVTIVDTRVLNCRCFLDQEQLSVIEGSGMPPAPAEESNKLASTANAKKNAIEQLPVTVESNGVEWTAKIASIGVVADPKTGLIPVVLEVQNPEESLRSGIQVNVHFHD
jgi:hypothetical protein